MTANNPTNNNTVFLFVSDLKIVYYKESKLVTVVEDDQKALFSIATTPRCKGRHYSFPWIAPVHP